MGKKIFVPWIICIIISVLLLFILGCVILFTLFTNIFGKRIDKKEIIETFTSNKQEFELVLGELKGYESIHIREGHDSYYTVYLNDGDEIFIDFKNNLDKHCDYYYSISLMEKLNIYDLNKDSNNISFTINSMFSFGQQIAFVSDMDNYKSKNSVTFTKNIIDNWFYIEID